MVVVYVLLGIIAAVVLLFCIKLTVEFRMEETTEAFLRVLFLKIPLLPAPEKKHKKKQPAEEEPKEEPAPEEEKPKEDKPAGDSFIKKFWNAQGFEGVVRFLHALLSALNTLFGDIFKRSFVIQKLFLRMQISKADAAQTAIAYGKTCAAVYPALGYLCTHLRVRQYDAEIVPDYLAKRSTAQLCMAVSVRPIKLTNALVRFAARAVLAFIRSQIYASKRKKAQKQSAAIERNVES